MLTLSNILFSGLLYGRFRKAILSITAPNHIINYPNYDVVFHSWKSIAELIL